MLTGKYVPAAHIMDRLFGIPFGFPPQHVHESDVYELIYRAMALINDPSAMLPQVALIQIVNHRGDLPCDLFCINTGGVRLYPGGNVFNLNTNIYFQDTDYSNTVEDDLPDENTQQLNIGGNITYIKDFDTSINTLVTNQATGGDYVYNLANEHIITPIESCTVEMSYRAFPTMKDSRGMIVPKIPDNERFINGVLYQVASNLAMYLYMKDLLSERKFEMINREALWYIGSAQNVGRIPSMDGAEIIKNIQLTTIQDAFHHKGGMANLYKPNLIRTHNSSNR